MTEALQDELDRLKQRREDLKAAIAAKKREAAQLQKKRGQALQQQLPRPLPALLSAAQAPHTPPYRPRRTHGKGGPPCCPA